jgi:AcrR family transcriptional regulator
MAREKLDTEIRQEQIAQAALSLIASRGIRGLSVAAVARRVGLVPSGIYRHFAGKDEVLSIALDYIGERLLANVHAAAADTADPLERLRRLLLRHVGMLRQNQGILRIMFSEDAYGDRPARRTKVLRMIQAYVEAIAGIVRDGQREKRLRSDADPHTVALMFLGLIQPAAILWHMSDGTFDVTEHCEKAWTILARAIAAR